MKMVKDLVPADGNKLYRYEVVNPNGSGIGQYMYLRYAPGDLAQDATPVNANLFNELAGFENKTITFTTNGITTIDTINGVTETVTFATNAVTRTRTDGTKTLKKITTFSGNSMAMEVVES